MSDDTATRQRSCADRISEHMESREQQFAEILGKAPNDGAACMRLAIEKGWVDHTEAQVEALITRFEADEDDQPYDTTDDADNEDTVGDTLDAWWDEAKEFLENRDTFEELDEAVLAVSTKVVMRVEISTGGPADYLEVDLSKERYGYGVDAVTYHFADWFDHAERSVDQDSYLWRVAQHFAEGLGEEI